LRPGPPRTGSFQSLSGTSAGKCPQALRFPKK
jgi:hypothetical protein